MDRNSKSEGVDRRQFMAIAGTVAGLTACPSLVRAKAAANMIKLGDIEITSFSDGFISLPPATLAANVTKEQRDKALAKMGQTGETYRSPVNVTMIKTPHDLIMVDVGGGPHFLSTTGRLAEVIEAAGVDPEAVTKVVYTHAHPDHMWGTVNDFDELSFPNASYHISEAERAFWTADDVLTKLPDERHAFAAGARRTINAIEDKLEIVKPGTDLATGVRVVDTAGHTPGHISIEVGNGNDTAMVLGDALTHPIISFEHPDWSPAVDQDKERGIATRKALLKQLAANNSRIIATHLPAPGIGRVVAKGTGFVYSAG